MSKSSDGKDPWSDQREKIIGLGERSLRKTYYPELQQKLDELERFRALLDQSNDCIFLIRASDLSLIDVNDSACRQLGWGRDELLTLPLKRLLPDPAYCRVRDLMDSASREADRDTITTELFKSAGGGFPAEITIKLVSFNKILYGVAVARDITDRKRAEEVLLENSRMLREMELARQIQLSLLPPAPPELPGLLLAGSCLPAAHVGGDYYDYFLREAGVVDLVIADVSGHSIGAALMAAEVRSVLHAEVSSFDRCSSMLHELTAVLYDDLNTAGLFLTISYAKYDPSTCQLTYSSAGHPPILLSRDSKTGCAELDAEGLILGVRKEVEFEERTVQLHAGDLVFLYTDGILEAQKEDGEMFGALRLCGILRSAHALHPREIIESVRRAVMEFVGGAGIGDDITMIAMKITGE